MLPRNVFWKGRRKRTRSAGVPPAVPWASRPRYRCTLLCLERERERDQQRRVIPVPVAKALKQNSDVCPVAEGIRTIAAAS